MQEQMEASTFLWEGATGRCAGKRDEVSRGPSSGFPWMYSLSSASWARWTVPISIALGLPAKRLSGCLGCGQGGIGRGGQKEGFQAVFS